MEECQFCYSPFDDYANSRVTCPYCDASCCFQCIKHMIIDLSKVAKCEFCKNLWSIKDMSKAGIRNDWIQTEHKEQRELLLLQQAKSYIPDAQRIVHRQKVRDQLLAEHEARLLESAKARYNGTGGLSSTIAIKRVIKELKSDDWMTVVDEYLAEQEDSSNGEASSSGDSGVDKDKRLLSTRKCAEKACSGYVENNICLLCNTRNCDKCWMTARDGHVCKEEDILSIKEIMETSKPCPKCGVIIFRSEGCSHMFCTRCKHGFNWITLKPIPNLYNTNPHLQQMRDQERRGVVATNNFPSRNLFIEYGDGIPYAKYFNDSIIRHNEIISKLETILTVKTVDNLKHAISYVEGKLTMTEWGEKLQQADKLNQRNEALAEVLNNYIRQCKPLLREINALNAEDRYQQLVKLKKETYNELTSTKKIFNSKIVINL